MPQRRFRRAVVLSLLVGSLLASAQQPPSGITAYPVQIYLSPKARSALLTLRNQTREEMRFQLSVFAWQQDPQGEMQLSPTEDIVFFPRLLILPAGAERKIRVGSVTPVAPTEKTYRLMVEQLPPMKKADPEEGIQIRMLTHMGIPIFLLPAKPVARAGLEALAVRAGRFSFQVKNEGNAHFMVQKIVVRGYGAAKEVLFAREIAGWYVLAGGLRVYELELPAAECPRVKTLGVEVKTDREVFGKSLAMPPDGCKH